MERGRGDIRESGQLIQFGSYDMCNGRNRGLESSLGGMFQEDVNLGIFQDIKVPGGGGGGGLREGVKQVMGRGNRGADPTS